METKKRIESLLFQIKKLEKEVNDIRNSCLHKKKSIKFVDQNSSHSNGFPRWFCVECGALKGIPSPSEIKEWLET